MLHSEKNDAVAMSRVLWRSHRMSTMDGTDIFSQWHYLNGIYIEDTDIGKFMIRWRDDLETMTKTLCTNKENCEEVENFFQTLDLARLNRLVDFLDQPQMHSDNKEDFVLIPLCSFGNDQLKRCDLFHKDGTCPNWEDYDKLRKQEEQRGE